MEMAVGLVASSSADHPEAVGQRSRQRSRVANGSALLPGVDGRSPWVRRAKEVIADHISDLGGIENCSAAERSIVRRASTLTVELERLEAKFATAGEASTADLETYQRWPTACGASSRRSVCGDGRATLRRR